MSGPLEKWFAAIQTSDGVPGAVVGLMRKCATCTARVKTFVPSASVSALLGSAAFSAFGFETSELNGSGPSGS